MKRKSNVEFDSLFRRNETEAEVSWLALLFNVQSLNWCYFKHMYITSCITEARKIAQQLSPAVFDPAYIICVQFCCQSSTVVDVCDVSAWKRVVRDRCLIVIGAWTVYIHYALTHFQTLIDKCDDLRLA